MTTRTYMVLDIVVGDTILPLFYSTAAPVNGTSGTLANVAIFGALLIYNGQLYQNTNTLASPTWSVGPSGAAVAITGGTIDGAAIGGTTPAAGKFTSVTSTGLNASSVETGITASTTQTLAGGYALTKAISVVATVANSGDAVTLPALATGQFIDIYNNGAHPANVFPNGSANQIDAGTAGAAVTLTNAKRCRFTCVALNTIISAQLGAVSA
jgi:hypothetical protein